MATWQFFSGHSSSEVQQLALGVQTQVPLLHTSTVQGFWSSQSAFPLQQFAMPLNEQRWSTQSVTPQGGA